MWTLDIDPILYKHMLVYFTFTDYQPGDENLVLAPEEVIGSKELQLEELDLRAIPNPVREKASISFQLKEAESI